MKKKSAKLTLDICTYECDRNGIYRASEILVNERRKEKKESNEADARCARDSIT